MPRVWVRRPHYIGQAEPSRVGPNQAKSNQADSRVGRFRESETRVTDITLLVVARVVTRVAGIVVRSAQPVSDSSIRN